MNLREGVLWFSYVYVLNLKKLQAQETEKRSSPNLVYIQREVLDSSYGLFGDLEWTIYRNESKIIFKLTKLGPPPMLNIVLGLSKTGNVKRGDFVVIRGPLSGPYQVENMYGTRINITEPNSIENWRLENVENFDEQSVGITVSRHINSCESADQTNVCINVSKSN